MSRDPPIRRVPIGAVTCGFVRSAVRVVTSDAGLCRGESWMKSWIGRWRRPLTVSRAWCRPCDRRELQGAPRAFSACWLVPGYATYAGDSRSRRSTRADSCQPISDRSWTIRGQWAVMGPRRSARDSRSERCRDGSVQWVQSPRGVCALPQQGHLLPVPPFDRVLVRSLCAVQRLHFARLPTAPAARRCRDYHAGCERPPPIRQSGHGGPLFADAVTGFGRRGN